MDFELESLQMFQQLLMQVSVSAADPEFENTSKKVLAAKKELEEAISIKMHQGKSVPS